MALTKADISSEIQEKTGYTLKKSTEVNEFILEAIKSNLKSGEDVLISGFGKFCVKKKNKRLGRNPATEEPLMVRERKVVTFKCSGNLRKRINGG
jgi:integration host factor subunit alpha